MFRSKLEIEVKPGLSSLDALDHTDHTGVLDHVASGVTALVRSAACFTFPLTGAASHKSNNIIQLQRKRRDLARLLRLSDATLSVSLLVLLLRPPAFSVVLSGSNSISVAWTPMAYVGRLIRGRDVIDRLGFRKHVS
jgi:hypothetical protein